MDLHKSNNTSNIIRIIDIPEVSLTGKYKIIDQKIISYIEKKVRNSYEYKAFISYLKNTLDINSCSYYEGFNIANGFKIEIHHAPFTLYDYTQTVCNKQMEENGGFFDALEVAEEVTRLHFLFKVGLVPLNPTAHELVHSGNLQIHPDLILGDYESFLSEYSKYLTDDIKEKILKLDDLKEEENKLPNILKKKEIKLLTPFKKMDGKKFISSTIEEKLQLLENYTEN